MYLLKPVHNFVKFFFFIYLPGLFPVFEKLITSVRMNLFISCNFTFKKNYPTVELVPSKSFHAHQSGKIKENLVYFIKISHI